MHLHVYAAGDCPHSGNDGMEGPIPGLDSCMIPEIPPVTSERLPVLPAILRLRCPRCRHGAVYRGLLRMNETCPTCDVRFEREQGYFLGAMYVSYGLAIAVASPVALGAHFVAGSSVETSGWISGGILVLTSPWIVRYSRVLWLYLDNAFDPV